MKRETHSHIVDLSGVRDRTSLHLRLQEALALPSWYGKNLDALYDALTDTPLPTKICFSRWEDLQEADPDYYDRFRDILRDVEAALPDSSFTFAETPDKPDECFVMKKNEIPEGVSAIEETEAPEKFSVTEETEAPEGFSVTEKTEALEEASAAEENAAPEEGREKPIGENRTLIITDIHGCYDECRELLDRMAFDEEKDTLINLGDTVDRGPKIYETFVFLRGLKERMGDRCILIRGNHEQMMLDAIAEGGGRRNLWYYNGGKKTVFSFLHNKYRVQEYIDWYEAMPYYYTTETFNCVHASLTDPDPAVNAIDTLIWGRGTDYSGKVVVTGHTPYRSPLYFLSGQCGEIEEDVWTVLPETGMIALDTGCVYGNRLTGMVIRNDGTFFVTSVRSNVKK